MDGARFRVRGDEEEVWATGTHFGMLVAVFLVRSPCRWVTSTLGDDVQVLDGWMGQYFGEERRWCWCCAPGFPPLLLLFLLPFLPFPASHHLPCPSYTPSYTPSHRRVAVRIKAAVVLMLVVRRRTEVDVACATRKNNNKYQENKQSIALEGKELINKGCKISIKCFEY
jgi:hypothetical protein